MQDMHELESTNGDDAHLLSLSSTATETILRNLIVAVVYHISLLSAATVQARLLARFGHRQGSYPDSCCFP
jgi:hypothetical protein